MTRLDSEVVGDLGVNVVEKHILREGHIFREQSKSDHGIDAHVEFREKTKMVSGRLVALQIKSGDDIFYHAVSGEWKYYPPQDKIDYWLRHVLPVYVAFYHPAADTAYIKLVTEEALEATRSDGLALVFRPDDVLDKKAIELMQEESHTSGVLSGVEYLRLSMAVRQDTPLSETLNLGIQHWFADGTDRCQMVLHRSDAEMITTEVARWTVSVPETQIITLIRSLFPWADLKINFDSYSREERDDWTDLLLETDTDPEDLPFETWRSTLAPLRPFARDDEVTNWELDLTTNSLGRSWHEVDSFLRESGY
ncbi:DUF4365 domain-containing protein [Clavibacter michiganensis]|uniref:DUF4365 domain-containing protein n=1 Tax=Clavibacter michiganensis TaxID=28447 RepID=UPI003EBFFF85